MTQNASLLAALLATTVLAAACGKAKVEDPEPRTAADTIYLGGDIVTLNDAQPTADALAVKDGRILAVGARTEIESAHKGATTRIVALAGKTQLPAFLDTHSH